MAKPSPLNIFLENFITYNLDRYKDNPAMVTALTGLTLDDCSIRVTAVAGPDLTTSVTHNGKVFIGFYQRYTSAKLNHTLSKSKITTIYSQDDILSAEPLKVLLMSGRDDVAYVGIPKGTPKEDWLGLVRQVFIDACYYELKENEIKQNGTKFRVESNNGIWGDIEAVEVAYDVVIPPTNYGQLKVNLPA